MPTDSDRAARRPQLLGSDYADGVHGVGIVNAMETIAAYGGSLEGLGAFAQWTRNWRGEGAEGADAQADGAGSEGALETEAALRAERRAAFERRHRTVRRNWVLPEGFPSRTIAEAYTRPVVDSSDAPCTWARPNLHELRRFCDDKFGWTQAKADELLLPMMAQIESGAAQATLDGHFSFQRKFARVGSTRLASALELHTLPPQGKKGAAAKARKPAPAKGAQTAKAVAAAATVAGAAEGDATATRRRSSRKQPAAQPRARRTGSASRASTTQHAKGTAATVFSSDDESPPADATRTAAPCTVFSSDEEESSTFAAHATSAAASGTKKRARARGDGTQSGNAASRAKKAPRSSRS